MNEREIFHAAIELTDPAARSAYLEKACAGDTALKQHVQGMLQAYPELGTFLESSAADTLREGPGTQIGPYKLLEQIGEGGFGVVYRAQQQPLHRAVAVKILKAGLDTRQVVARFEAERQALALMDHPSIAHALDGGETSSGRPFFVMDLVDGVPITRSCAEHHLPLRQRVALFIDVCQAVQHAHQKGIIHRDLKPTNVLVAQVDGQPVPKLIDFGVAKAVGQRLSERTVITGAGGVIGTLEYMSPEQADFHAVDIDTRADIYSLGVLLYELLTGTTPLTHARIKDTPITETLRRIREEDPPRPSSRLSELQGAAEANATWRNLDPMRRTRLRKEMRGDLDWIVMKALEKDRDRRYATAGDFAQDLQRFLDGEAILARPPSAAYRMRKFVQRHRGAVLAGTAVTMALVMGTVIATWQAVVATQAHVDALNAAQAENQAKIAAAAKEAETQAVLDFVLNRILAAARPEGRPGGLGPDVKLRSALEAALPAVEKSFADQPLVEARLRMTLGDSFGFLGDNKIAAAQYARARVLYTAHLGPDHVDTLRSMHNLATALSQLGGNHHKEALELRQETLARRRATLGPDHIDTLMSMRNLASSYADMRDYKAACELEEETLPRVRAKLGPSHSDTLKCMNNLALTYKDLGRLKAAAKLQEEVLKLYQDTPRGADHPDTLLAMNNLAVTYNDLKRHAQSIQLHEEALKVQSRVNADHPDTAVSMYNLGNSYGNAGKLAQARLGLALMFGDFVNAPEWHTAARADFTKALEWHAAALQLRKIKLGLDHKSTLWSMWGVSAQLMKLNRGAEAVPLIDECLEQAAKMKVQPNLLGLADLRLKYFAKLKDPVGCRTTAELWEKLKCTDPASLYNAACYRAATARVLRQTDVAPDALKQGDAEADQAMVWLRQAVAAGYANLKNLGQDSNLDALRDRADFQQLIGQLEAGQQK